ncbi:MAG: HAD-IA family hydrolase [Gammaproteobacteria bacterium]|nr:HAD-IA family hydrolase [Gammaproteobacteria bacterium]
MDGTLTIAVHDFGRIRAELGIPEGAAILEYIDAQTAATAQNLRGRLAELEGEYARAAKPQPGAHEFLEQLARRGARLGILTRNSNAVAHDTLGNARLSRFFADADILGHDCVTPKPSPAGVQLLMQRWQATCEATVMVGDYLYDIEAGQAAGVTTVYYDANDDNQWTAQADFRVTGYQALKRLAKQSE